MADDKTTVAFCGYGRAGKDEAGMWLSRISSLKYYSSLSWIGLPIVAEALGLPQQLAWDTRHDRRLEWYEILNRYREADPTRLVRESLKHGSIVVGVRSREELVACREAKLLTHAVWIERPGISVDPTVTYNILDCDHVIVNNGSLEDLFRKIEVWAARHRIPGVTVIPSPGAD